MTALLPGWGQRLAAAARNDADSTITLVLPKAPQYYAQQIQFIDSPEAARDLADFAAQRPLAFAGIDTEFAYDSPAAKISQGKEAQDARSIRPLLLSLALAEPLAMGGGLLYVVVVDVRSPATAAALRPFLELPICFVGHALKAELFCLWKLGLPEPLMVWDTFIHERASLLGRHNRHYGNGSDSGDMVDQIQAKRAADEDREFSCSLLATCQRQGIAHRFADAKKRLQQSFLAHVPEQPFSEEQIEYAAEDAIAAAQLYAAQIAAAASAGLLQHLITVEMSWVVTTARMQWHGVRVDAAKREGALNLVGAVHATLKERLSELGLDNANSHKQLQSFFGRLGLLEAFRTRDGCSFDKAQIHRNKHLHPAIELLNHARRASDILSEQLLLPELVGVDGRVHPDYVLLGADTGRQSSKAPNVLGVSRLLRPVIVPETGYGIGEVDLAQIEVGIAAAVYGDPRLIDMFNSGDVYSAMAQLFFAAELSEVDRSMPSREFKGRHSDKRSVMKVCTLGIIYGMTAEGMARQLSVPPQRARLLLEKFMSMFPILRRARDEAVNFGALRGYALTMTGLRRHRGRKGEPTTWERNWLSNHPVQGSAAAAFKKAGNRLDKLYRRYQARLLIPLHDSFIFEAPLSDLNVVAQLTADVMCQAVQESFPALQPRADINVIHPDCWNKEGDREPMSTWIGQLRGLLVKLDLPTEGLPTQEDYAAAGDAS